jgi:hypothetical protein
MKFFLYNKFYPRINILHLGKDKRLLLLGGLHLGPRVIGIKIRLLGNFLKRE